MSTSGGDSRVSNVRRWRLRRSARLVKPDADVVAFYMAPGILILANIGLLFAPTAGSPEAWGLGFFSMLVTLPFLTAFACAVGVGVLAKVWPWRYRGWVCGVNLAGLSAAVALYWPALG